MGRMTTTSDELELAADFAPATYDDWRKLVDGVLKVRRSRNSSARPPMD